MNQQLITEKINEVQEKRRKLEDTLKSLQGEINQVQDELDGLQGAMEALVELKASIEPSIGEDDIKDYMDMMYLLRNFENITNDRKKKKQLMTKFGISNKEINLILSIAPLFLGIEDGITTYGEIAASISQHSKKFVYNSKDNIDGHDISYAGYRDLIKAITTRKILR